MWIYETDKSNECRYILGHFTSNPIVCVGVNPSTATPEKLDNTIRSVERISKSNGYDGWVMINLYPQRATNPDDLDNEADEDKTEINYKEIKEFLNTYDIKEIWAAWGTLIKKRKYLLTELRALYELTKDLKWITFGAVSKDGHPHHPLYLNSKAEKEKFDIHAYLKANNRKFEDHYEFYKENEDDRIWQVDHYVIETGYTPTVDDFVDGKIIGELLYSFDKKKIYNLWVDYPYNFTDEELEIFAQEQPYWVDFFKDRI